MPCNDCSRTEACPPCPEEDRPLFYPGAEEYYREVLGLEPKKNPDLQCTCGCPRSSHMGRPQGCNPHGLHDFTCDHTRCGWKPGGPADCAHVGSRVAGKDAAPGRTHFQCDDCGAKWSRSHSNWKEKIVEPEESHEFVHEEHCNDCAKAWDDQLKGVAMIPLPRAEPEEPPLTPEEEEELAEDEPRCTCGETACESDLCDCDCAPCPVDHAREAEPGPEHVCETYYCPTAGEVESACHGGFDQCCDAPEKHVPADQAPPPPQPNRRPPYAVAYSVQGHLFEVALPGDASVKAMDGALIIQHHLGPVSGIVQVLPVINEEK